MIDNWEKNLKEQVSRDFENYKIVTIDLGTARVNELKAIAGSCIKVIAASSRSAAATIRINKTVNDEIALYFRRKIETIFTQFYLTNSAQTGESITLLIGINFDITDDDQDRSDSEAQGAITITNASADTDTQGASNVCDRALIRAHTGNAGTVWVDFGQAAVENACYELTAGDAVSVPISNTNRIHALFKAANDIITVIFEV